MIRLLIGLLWLGLASPALAAGEPFPPLDARREVYDPAIAQANVKPLRERVSGIVVPHHLLAADLMARTFALIGGQKVERVIILCPDHFRQSPTPFATTDRDFQTVYGLLKTDAAAARSLAKNPLLSLSGLFTREHGIQALLPFVSAYFPKAAILPVAARITAKPEECERLAAMLAPLLSPTTLVVLSADFSHHLTGEKAKSMDQQSLCSLANNEPKDILSLRQPDNLDTVAMLYVQSLLQKKLGASFQALANRNSEDYTGKTMEDATSYIAGVWGAHGSIPALGQRLYFGGDTFFGRNLSLPLRDPAKQRDLVRRVRELTGGGPLVLNLEGVLAESCPAGLREKQLCMSNLPSLTLLRDMGVRAVSLANNHTLDLGAPAYAQMQQELGQNGITVIEKNSLVDLGVLRLAAFTDLENGKSRSDTAITQQDLGVLEAIPKDKPLVAFVHWGQEWAVEPDMRQWHLHDILRDRGVSLVVGGHSHLPGIFTCSNSGCLASSLGNFVFDQTRRDSSGTLLEITIFPQGTWFARPIPIGNLGGELMAAP
ncbi:MAG: AmmeMemoRadiSam system protein B [Solidesulfovibrio sp.]